jgi:hypothetical protein
MTKQVQRRRGTAAQHTSFTGAEGEISVNTTNKSVHVHDGTTAGGIEAARADLGNVSDANLNAALSGNTLASLTITSADINGGTIDGTVIGGSTDWEFLRLSVGRRGPHRGHQHAVRGCGEQSGWCGDE